MFFINAGFWLVLSGISLARVSGGSFLAAALLAVLMVGTPASCW
jgi:hypothetical protein